MQLKHKSSTENGQWFRLLLSLLSLVAITGQPALIPPDFSVAFVGDVGAACTKMAIAKDGRIFVSEKNGRIWIFEDGVKQDIPFLDMTATTSTIWEYGFYQLVFDPDFDTNGWVYLFYTTTIDDPHDRVSRFTANADRTFADPDTEFVLLNFPTLILDNHLGGAMDLHPDGTLFITHGDNSLNYPSQDLNNMMGKMLRIHLNGTIPTDNPFYDTLKGSLRAIYSSGLRSPFSMGIDPDADSGLVYFNDVGQSTWEEINDVVSGGNYGWPQRQGTSGTNLPDVPTIDPVYQYPHDNIQDEFGCAITAGTFYRPLNTNFPGEYVGKYFFSEFCQGWWAVFDPATRSVTRFADGDGSLNVVDMKVNPAGELYFLQFGGGKVFKITYTGTELAPVIVSQPKDVLAPVGSDASFSFSTIGSFPLTYQWKRNGVAIIGANAASYTLNNVQLSDNGAVFQGMVQNAFGSESSANTTLYVTDNTLPVAIIDTPVLGSTYTGGSVISFSGSGTDPEDGILTESAMSWHIDLHHDAHFHPSMPETPGIFNGTFAIGVGGETSPNVWYRVHLTVTDSDGFSFKTYRDVTPIISDITITTIPPGYEILLDEQPHTASYVVTSVVGINRELGVPSVQYQGGSVWAFDSWSDGESESHYIVTPVADTEYTVKFVEIGGACTFVRILQNRGDKYATLDTVDNLSWDFGTTQKAGAEVFVREQTAQGFTLKATSNDNYVVLAGDAAATTLAASGTVGAILAEEACGTNPAGFGAIRVDNNADGNPLNDQGNYWQSMNSVGQTGSCNGEDAVAWEKFQVEVISVDFNCNGPGPNATCFDGIQNQEEEGVDCGGLCAVCAAATCSDDIQNQNEEDVDCGGPCADCVTATCFDGIQNQDELGVDCGGQFCAACATPTCSDNIKNQDEVGVDCGGQVCDACPGVCGDGIVDVDLFEECDDGNTDSCDSCDSNCKNETAAGTCDQVVVLQNKGGGVYVTLDEVNALSYVDGAAAEGDAEVFIRESTSCGFTLKSISNGNFVNILNNGLSATGTTGVVLNTEECGTNPTGFGALRADTDGDGNAFNDEGNFWKSNDIIGLTGGCNGEDGIAWEKFQLVVTLADVVCPSTRRLRGPIPVTSGSKFIVPP